MEVNLTGWIDEQRKRLAVQPIVGYALREPATAEPVSIAAIAACSCRLKDPADTATRRLSDAQNQDGSVSVRLNEEGPFWTTSLACIAWRQFEKCWPELAGTRCRDAYRKGLDYLTGCGGEKLPQDNVFGHDTSLVGWPWVLGTHSWLEPTSLALMAMRQGGLEMHPRAIEAARLLVDRQLPSGGANFGNTTVLGRPQRPHVLPSAMSVVAFHRVQPMPRPLRITTDFLRGELSRPLGSVSLSWLVHALVSDAWDSADGWESAFEQPIRAAISRMEMSESNPHRQNLLLLALQMRESALLDVAPMQWKDIEEASAHG